MKRNAKAVSLVFAAMLASCGGTGTATATQSNWVILSGASGRALFNQCSRGVPPPGQAEWTPSEADIDAFEAALPMALLERPEAKEVNFTKLLSGWRRQYVGIMRGGQRFIYGNFFPAGMAHDFEKWGSEPAMVCDGGPSFFGAEFDVAAHRVTQLDFNGVG
jgi:hypothetical protein